MDKAAFLPKTTDIQSIRSQKLFVVVRTRCALIETWKIKIADKPALGTAAVLEEVIERM